MDDGVRAAAAHGREHGVAVGDVELAVGRRRPPRGRRRQRRRSSVPTCPPAPGDEDLHERAQRAAARGSHHQRLSRYQLTVWPERLVEVVAAAPAERADLGRCRPSSGGRGPAGPATYSIIDSSWPSSASRRVDEVPVGGLVAGADVVDLAGRALAQHQVDAGAVVVDVEPVAHVQAVAVERHLRAVEQVGDEQRDDLLGVLVGPEVVRAAGDHDRQAVGLVVRRARSGRSRPSTPSTASGARAGRSPSNEPSSTEPYTSSVAMCTKRSTSSWRAMSHTTLVPKQLVLTKSSGPTIERSTWLSAAKCTTASWPAHGLGHGVRGRRCRPSRSGSAGRPRRRGGCRGCRRR